MCALAFGVFGLAAFWAAMRAERRSPDSLKLIRVGILLSFTEVFDVVRLESKLFMTPVVPFIVCDI